MKRKRIRKTICSCLFIICASALLYCSYFSLTEGQAIRQLERQHLLEGGKALWTYESTTSYIANGRGFYHYNYHVWDYGEVYVVYQLKNDLWHIAGQVVQIEKSIPNQPIILEREKDMGRSVHALAMGEEPSSVQIQLEQETITYPLQSCQAVGEGLWYIQFSDERGMFSYYDNEGLQYNNQYKMMT